MAKLGSELRSEFQSSNVTFYLCVMLQAFEDCLVIDKQGSVFVQKLEVNVRLLNSNDKIPTQWPI